MMEIQAVIEKAWDDRELLLTQKEKIKSAITQVLEGLNKGSLAVVAKKDDQKWQVCEWIKKGILLYFAVIDARQGYQAYPFAFDKVPLKFADWGESDYKRAGIRAVPGSIVRNGSFISKGVVLMPSFINIGAYVGADTMIDTWATVGSCAYVGKNCHISGGVGIGGCLEPIQGKPVIIEDNCFIGGRCQLAEGVRVGRGCVLATGTNLTASTKIIYKDTGREIFGEIPPFSVIIPGTYKKETSDGRELWYNCAYIIKTVDEKIRSKVSLNDLLR